MIPKIVHYTWLGRNEMPERAIRNLEGWKKLCPDYEFKLWNEDNFDINYNEFTKKSYEMKKYAFTNDVTRLYAIYKEGGIYLDLGVEMLKPIDDLLKDCKCFFAFSSEIQVALGKGFASEKNSPIIKHILDDYNNIVINENVKASRLASPALNTKALVEACPKIKLQGKTQTVDGVKLISCGDYSEYLDNVGFQTWAGSKVKAKRKKYKNTFIKRKLKSEKIVLFCNKHNKNVFVKGYLFFIYDFIEFGPIYYIKKIIKK